MSLWLKIAIAGVCALAFVALLILYGNSKYDAGVSDTVAAEVQANSKAQDDGRKSIEANTIKARAVPADNIDDEFERLGLLRH